METPVDRMLFDNVALVGCGAVGSHLALMICRYSRNFMLFDNDRVEAGNIGNTAFDRTDIGRRKAERLSMKMMARGVQVIGVDTRDILKTKEFKDFDLVIDCLDNPKARNHVSSIAGRTPLMHVGVIWNTGEITWGPREYSVEEHPDDARPCTRDFGEMIIFKAAALAAEQVAIFANTGEQRTVIFNTDRRA